MTDAPDFYRIRRLPPYVFAEVNAMKAAARARGEDIIDLGMGNPDGAPPRARDREARRGRPQSRARIAIRRPRGSPGCASAQAAYYQRRFGVELDPDSEVIVTLGSKEGLANLAQAITAPGDVVLAPNPSYPIHTFGFIIAGAAIRSIPAAPGPDFFEMLERAVRYTVPAPKVLVIGYPSNPTAYVADLAFYEQVVAFAREHGLWVISDLAYAEIYFGDDADALDPAGAGRQGGGGRVHLPCPRPIRWRAGGSASRSAIAALVGALARVKSYLDYGAFTPIQAAATAALNGPQDIVDGQPRALQRPARRAGRLLRPRRLGDPAAAKRACSPGRRSPSPSAHLGSMEFAKRLLAEAGVAVAPGVGFGEEGEGYVRIALVENEQRLRQAARGVKAFLAKGP